MLTSKSILTIALISGQGTKPKSCYETPQNKNLKIIQNFTKELQNKADKDIREKKETMP